MAKKTELEVDPPVLVSDIDFTKDIEPVDDPIFQQVEEKPKDPTQLDPEWENFILAKFTPNELVKGRPKVIGMRRVIREYFGPIVENLTEAIECPSLANGQRCTAKNTITVLINKGNALGECQEPYEVTYSDIADAWPENVTGIEFKRYPVAMAGTRAESRTLRKILSIATPAAEEISDQPADEGALEGRISINQINRIDVKCEQLNINVMKFINIGKNKYSKIEQVPYESAVKMFKFLGEYERNEQEIPEQIQGYVEDWRK